MQEQSYQRMRQQCIRLDALLHELAILIGDIPFSWVSWKTGDMLIPGLGLKQEASYLLNIANHLQQGLCRIQVIGSCKAGKSTALNALLLRSTSQESEHEHASPSLDDDAETLSQDANALESPLLPMGQRLTTAVVTNVVYGSQAQITLYEEGNSEPTLLDRESFLSFYTFPQDTPITMDHHGYMDTPFKHIKYIQIEHPYTALKYHMRFTDTPGLNVRLGHPLVSSYTFKRPDTAFVVILNAMNPFPYEVEAFLKEVQQADQLPKIFFAVNRIDQVAAEKLDLTRTVIRSRLQSFFADTAGNFLTDLYREHVFFTNFRQALHLRAENRHDESALAQTGILALEQALMAYFIQPETVAHLLKPLNQAIESTMGQVKQVIEQNISLVNTYQKNTENRFSLLRENQRLHLLRVTISAQMQQIQAELAGISAYHTPSARVETNTFASEAPEIADVCASAFALLDKMTLADAAKAPLYTQLHTFLHAYSNPTITVAVVGEFNSGKSTFINALFRQELLKTSPLVATAIPTHIRYGPHLDLTVQFKQSSQPLNYDRDAQQLWQILRGIAPQFAQGTTQDLRACLRALTATDSIAAHIQYLCLTHPSYLLAQGITIIDTPGLDSENPLHAAVTRSIIEQEADLVVILTPSSFALSALLREFLTEELLPLQKSLLFILAQMDKLDGEDEQHLVIKNTRKRLLALPGIAADTPLLTMAARAILQTIQARGEKETANRQWNEHFFKLENTLWNYIMHDLKSTRRQRFLLRLEDICTRVINHIYQQRLNEDEDIVKDLVNLQQNLDGVRIHLKGN